MHVDLVLSALFESVASTVASVSVVVGLDFNGSRSADGDTEVISSEGLGLSVLVPGLDGEVEGGEARKASISSGLAVHMDWHALDGMTLKIDVDDVVSWVLWVVGDGVGTVVVVNDVWLLVRAVWVLDVDVEVITSVVAWLTVLVDSVDGENTGFVIDERNEAWAFGIGVVDVGGLLDVGVEGRVLDGVSV